MSSHGASNDTVTCHHCGDTITENIEDHESMEICGKYVCDNAECVSIEMELSRIHDEWIHETSQNRMPNGRKVRNLESVMSHFK